MTRSTQARQDEWREAEEHRIAAIPVILILTDWSILLRTNAVFALPNELWPKILRSLV